MNFQPVGLIKLPHLRKEWGQSLNCELIKNQIL